MFTLGETQFLIAVMRDKARETASRSLAERILGKLLCIGDYYVTLYCAGCENWQNTVEFSGDHTCRRCGRRICDDCHKAYGDLCDSCDRKPPDPDEAFYKAADVLRDWAMDR
jgi:hypothetical protein